jgi:hypothetical protein
MRIAVSYRPEDGGFGGRLRDDLGRWLPCDEVVPARHADYDVLVAVVGTEWRVESSDDPVRRSLEAAMPRGTAVIAVVLPGASMPASDLLPPALAGLPEVDAVTASDEYWEPMVGRVVELTRRLPAASRGALRRRVRGRRGVSLGAAVATVAAIVGILSQIGVFADDPSEWAEVRVDARVANDVNREDHARTDPDVGQPPAAAAHPDASSGFAYSVGLRLHDATHDRYGLRWTFLDVTQSRPKRGYENVLWRTYTVEEVDGVHSVWVPCPADDTVPYVVRFALTNESVRPRKRLEHADGKQLECRPDPPALPAP